MALTGKPQDGATPAHEQQLIEAAEREVAGWDGGGDGSRATGPAPPPQSFPGYNLIREMHRGGQGVVYEAVQLSTNRTVAFKVMLDGPLSSERARSRFEREVRLAASLKHPNIVAIHDSGIAQGRYYFAMDYVRGQPLDTHIRLSASSAREIVRLMVEICDAVSYAHRHGIIHRDLKPSNILVGENGKPQVLDFGLAKLADEQIEGAGHITVTMPGQLLGTLRYMSPEQTVGNPDMIDTRTDVYALGVILYELLTGKAPYDTNVDLAVALKNIREADPPRVSRVQRGINSEMDAIILKAMHKEQGRRYQSAGEFEQDLLAWLDGRPVTAKSDSAFYVFRKLAARHYFHTSVIAALVASIVAFGSISYQAYLRADRALQDKTLSEKSMKDALQDMSKFKSEAIEQIRQQALGWFLAEWRAGRLDQARAIRDQIKNRESAEYLVMSFFLDEGVSADDLRQRLPADAESLLHFVIGEQHVRTGNIREAIAEFEAAVRIHKNQGIRDAWYIQSAAAQLNQLRQSSTGAAETAASRPTKEPGVP